MLFLVFAKYGMKNCLLCVPDDQCMVVCVPNFFYTLLLMLMPHFEFFMWQVNFMLEYVTTLNSCLYETTL